MTTTGPATAPTTAPPDMRAQFYAQLPGLLADHPRAAALFAEIGVGYLDQDAIAPVADRVLNVGIRAIGL